MGVDIDHQAVEVTKLSLLLKVLEGENEQTIGRQLSLFQERVLPDLHNNIKCGNSLIGPDFYHGKQMTLINEDEMFRINVFDWETEFPEIMKNGGFDAVIGNPPYLRIQGLQEYYGDQIYYLKENYQSAVKRFDLYLLFAEIGFKLLCKKAYLGFICPHKFLNSDFGSGMRKFLIDNTAIDCFVSFGNNLIFNKASTYTGILILQKDENNLFNYYEFSDTRNEDVPLRLANLSEEEFTQYKFTNLTTKPWILTSSSTQIVINKIQQQLSTVGSVFESVFQGVVTGIDEVYFLKRLSNVEKSGIIDVFSQREKKNIKIELAILKPMLKGDNISRYVEPDFQYYCIYPYKMIRNKTVIMEENELSNSFPLAFKYLQKYRNELRELRIKYKTNQRYWYSCHRGRSIALFERKRVITPEICLGCNMTFAPAGIFHNTQVYSLLPSFDQSEQMEYWLGLLNSKLLWWFLTNTGNVLRGGYFRFKTNYLKPFPIHTINFENPSDKSNHDRMVSLVDQMLDFHKQLAQTKLPQKKTVLKRQIEATDRQIDELVYELYDLTEEEIKIVESGS